MGAHAAAIRGKSVSSRVTIILGAHIALLLIWQIAAILNPDARPRCIAGVNFRATAGKTIRYGA